MTSGQERGEKNVAVCCQREGDGLLSDLNSIDYWERKWKTPVIMS